MQHPQIDEKVRQRIAEVVAHAHQNPVSEEDQDRGLRGIGLAEQIPWVVAIPPDFEAIYTLDEMVPECGYPYARHLTLGCKGGKPSKGSMERVMKAFGFDKPFDAYMSVDLGDLPTLQILELLESRPQ